MDYTTVKALHIIFVVTWFAGLFYIFRLFVYHVEANAKPVDVKTILIDQYKVMEKRLWYIITWPSAILALTFGIWMLFLNTSLIFQPYMQVKLAFVALLVIYQLYGQKLLVKLHKDPEAVSSMKMRFMNEVATVILIAIVFIIVKRDALDWLYGVFGILGVAVVLTVAIKWYKRFRNKKEK